MILSVCFLFSPSQLCQLLEKHRNELGGRLEHFPQLRASLKMCPFRGTQLPEQSRKDASLRHLISEAEALYMSSFSNQTKPGNISSVAKAQREQAMCELEVARDGGAATWVNLLTTWQLGVVVGVGAIVVAVLASLSSYPDATPVSAAVLVPLYRLSGMATLIA